MQPRMKLGFVFHMCNDVVEIRDFYEKVVGAPIESFEKDSWVSIDLGVSVIFFKGDYELPVEKGWAWQPGYKGGVENLTSFSITIEDEDTLRKAYESAREFHVPMFNEKPDWRRDAYWGLTLRDPMGHTVELAYSPKSKPDSLEWR